MDLLLVRHNQPLDEMRTKRAQRRRLAQKPIPPWQWATESRKELPDPFSSAWNTDDEERRQREYQDSCYCCEGRFDKRESEDAEFADEYQRRMEMAREDPWKHLWPDYSGPDSEQDSFPTWQEFESYQRAFPWLFQEGA